MMRYYITIAFYLSIISCNVKVKKSLQNLRGHSEALRNSNSFSYDNGRCIRLVKPISTHSSDERIYLIIDIHKKAISDTLLTFSLGKLNNEETIEPIILELHKLDSLEQENYFEFPNTLKGLIVKSGQVTIKSLLSKANRGEISISIKEGNMSDSSKFISVRGSNINFKDISSKELKIDSFFVENIIYKGDMQQDSISELQDETLRLLKKHIKYQKN